MRINLHYYTTNIISCLQQSKIYPRITFFRILAYTFTDITILEVFMEIKRESIDKLLSLNDWQLKMIIQRALLSREMERE